MRRILLLFALSSLCNLPADIERLDLVEIKELVLRAEPTSFMVFENVYRKQSLIA